MFVGYAKAGNILCFYGQMLLKILSNKKIIALSKNGKI